MATLADNESELRRNFEPEERIQEQIPRIMAAAAGDPEYDPIIQDLMKMNPPPPLPSEAEMKAAEETQLETSLVEYSLHLAEVLDFLLNQKLDDSTRIEYEKNLMGLIASVPILLADKDLWVYPDDHLSRILIDNYLQLLKLASLYFNMSLASHVTTFLVKIIYKLECWEIYHLLHIIPDIEYYLKLVDIEVTHTPFGHIVRPPENLMNFNMRQGFQYPFPFPFYSFSYHTPDPYASTRKYARVHIDNYIDLLLKQPARKRRRPQSWLKPSKQQDEETEIQNVPASDELLHSPPVLKSQGSGRFSSELDYQKHHKVYIFMEMSPAQIDQEDKEFNKGEEEEEEYDADEAFEIMAEENAAVNMSRLLTDGYVIVPSVFERILHEAEKKGISKLTTLHQCRLLDPGTQRPCLKIFYGKNELHRHQEFVHATTKKVYRCTYCENTGNRQQTYPRHDSLARHIRRKHGVTGRENKMAVTLAKQYADVGTENVYPEGVGSTSASVPAGVVMGTSSTATLAHPSSIVPILPSTGGVPVVLPSSGPSSGIVGRPGLNSRTGPIPGNAVAQTGIPPGVPSMGPSSGMYPGVPTGVPTGFTGVSPGASTVPPVPARVKPGPKPRAKPGPKPGSKQAPRFSAKPGRPKPGPEPALAQYQPTAQSVPQSSQAPGSLQPSARIPDSKTFYMSQPPISYYSKDGQQRVPDPYMYDYRRDQTMQQLSLMQQPSLMHGLPIQGLSMQGPSMQGLSIQGLSQMRATPMQSAVPGASPIQGRKGSGNTIPNAQMQGMSTYSVPYAKFTPWLPTQGDKDDEARGFQKFRFPSNYYPMGFQPYRYGQEASYPVQRQAGYTVGPERATEPRIDQSQSQSQSQSQDQKENKKQKDNQNRSQAPSLNPNQSQSQVQNLNENQIQNPNSNLNQNENQNQNQSSDQSQNLNLTKNPSASA